MKTSISMDALEMVEFNWKVFQKELVTKEAVEKVLL